MHNSPLIIDFYFVKKVQFELKGGFDENFDRESLTVEPPQLSINVAAGKNTENPLVWRFELSIEANEQESEEDFPYTFNIILVGYFRVDEDYPSENAEMLARVNAPSVLYSAAREFLANVTGRSPYMAILLPSVSFVPTQEEQEKKEKRTSKSQKPKSKEKSTSKKSSVRKK